MASWSSTSSACRLMHAGRHATHNMHADSMTTSATYHVFLSILLDSIASCLQCVMAFYLRRGLWLWPTVWVSLQGCLGTPCTYQGGGGPGLQDAVQDATRSDGVRRHCHRNHRCIYLRRCCRS